MNTIEIKDGSMIPYVAMTPKLGRAEFTICYKHKRGKLTDIWITPLQQEGELSDYHLLCEGRSSFSLHSWMYKGKENPWAWIYGWCETHKCPFMHVYVPLNTNFVKIEKLGTIQIIFE